MRKPASAGTLQSHDRSPPGPRSRLPLLDPACEFAVFRPRALAGRLVVVRQLVILGAGELARQIAGLVEDINQDTDTYTLVGVLDRDTDKASADLPVLGDDDLLGRLDADYVLGVGAPDLRRKVGEKADGLGATAASLVHPLARVGRGATVGPGALLLEGTHVLYGATVGRHALVNVSSIIGHDSHVGDYVTLATSATVGARATIGDEVMLGMGSIVMNDAKVGDRSVVGAGAVVTRDVPPDTCVAGVPARPLPTR
ncbi:hypothetical protein DI005_23985 [Prauserella sp. PE36]|uniref:Acetyltransferase n=1 Tax=Prauserella endophytica TaxID=1592324 RepID=A0ABY2S1M1_9PSEU|nr:hypothetical protein DI005_23985 [Prauserella sp. PE36]TKG66651.1 acetyltransferase [Prauserella endophytica]